VSAAFKSLVEQIITDAGFRGTFIAKPREALNRQLISAAERRALMRARQRLLLSATDRDIPVAYNPFEWP
jgi:hypothetical protein